MSAGGLSVEDFDGSDYPSCVDGRPRYEGVRALLTSAAMQDEQ
ncbi:MAG: hypothetical protein ABI862_18925 [Ilumatobacteraceae bacterium]